MADEMKALVSKEVTFDRLEIRLGKVVNIASAEGAPKASYVLTVDFGKFGVRTSVGRFTQHAKEDLVGKLVMGVLNFEARQIGAHMSEFLCLGVQYPKADSGEATSVVPLADGVKLGSKLF